MEKENKWNISVIEKNPDNSENTTKKLNYVQQHSSDTLNFTNDTSLATTVITNGVESLVKLLANSSINHVKINSDIKRAIQNISDLSEINALIESFTQRINEIETRPVTNKIFIKGTLNAVIKLLNTQSTVIESSKALFANIHEEDVLTHIKNIKSNIDELFHVDMNEVTKLSDIIAKNISKIVSIETLEHFKSYISAKRQDTSSDWIFFAFENTILPSIERHIVELKSSKIDKIHDE